jgi:hypothetical protein
VALWATKGKRSWLSTLARKLFILFCVKKWLLLPLLLSAVPAAAQLVDTFADGNFTQNPIWTGDVVSFQVNAAQQLQTNGPAVTGTALQLVTPCAATTGTTWEFWANLKLATSGGNYADVWLMADQPDLKASSTKGYFVRLGGTTDEVSLFRKDATGSPVYVINGADGTLKSTNNNLVRVRVTRTVQNQWKLEHDLTGGVAYVSEGTAPDATHQRSAYCGVYVTYSSANSKAFYFDDFRVTDAAAPLLVKATVPAAQQLDLTFNETVALGQSASSYRLSSGLAATTAQRDATDPSLVHLTFATDLPFGAITVEARDVADQFGNVAAGSLMATVQNNGFPVLPKLNQLLITEIMADETPVVGLPASEFVEIHNPSATALLDLAGVRLLKPGSTSSPAVFPAGAVLLPGEYAVVCGSTRAAQFVAYGKVFGLSNFPSLTNAADQLVLLGKDGRTLFEISYSDAWYKDTRKKDGGWTLEMLNTANPCGGLENWAGSLDPSGGTPGRRNSGQTATPDRTAPKLLRALALSATSVRLFFAEKLDSVGAAAPALYALSTGTVVVRAAPISPDFRVVDLTLGTPLVPNQPLTVTAQRAIDCAGNAAGPATSAPFALPVPVAPGNVVVNEVLFNPRSGGVDFVELLNRSATYIDMRGWQLGGQKTDGSLAWEPISAEAWVLGPGQLVVLTTRPDVVQAQYSTNNPEAFLALPALPSYPDASGLVVVADALGKELDRYAYDEKQHLALLDSRDGVSLERIRAAGPGLPVNFHSAASSVGYATPGRPNSQQQQSDPAGTGILTLEPELFTPDDDGQQDFTTLSYRLDGPGYVGSVTIYDAQGRLVRQLARNETLPTTGFWRWDGLNAQNQKAAVGYYVLLVELFRADGGAVA